MKKTTENIFYYHKTKMLIIILVLIGLVTDISDTVRYLYVNNGENPIIYIAKNHLPWISSENISNWSHYFQTTGGVQLTDGIGKYGGSFDNKFYSIGVSLKPNPDFYRKSSVGIGYYQNSITGEDVLFKPYANVYIYSYLDENNPEKSTEIYYDGYFNVYRDLYNKEGRIRIYIDNLNKDDYAIDINMSNGNFKYDTPQNEQYMLETYGLTADNIIEKVSNSQKIFWRDYNRMYIFAIIFQICKRIIFVIIGAHFINKIIKEEKEQG